MIPFKIGIKKHYQFKYSSEDIYFEDMAEGTRLKDLNEHIKVIEEKMQTLTADCNQVWENKFQQFETEYNRRLGVVVQQLDEMQREGQQRFEAQQIESTRRHEQPIKLFNSQSPVVKSPSQALIPARDNKSTFEFSPSSSFRSTNHEEGQVYLTNSTGGL